MLEVGVEELDWAREEIAFYAFGVEDAEFDVKAVGEVGAGVDRAAFVEGAADGVKRREAFFLAGMVHEFDDGTVELAVCSFVDRD